jgi:hypothetical protein
MQAETLFLMSFSLRQPKIVKVISAQLIQKVATGLIV